MNPYRHELVHRLRSRTTIAVAVPALLGVALGYSSIEGAVTQVSITGAGVEYYAGGAYHVDLWVYDLTGRPVPGFHPDLAVGLPQNFTVYPPPPPPPPLFNQSATSGASGEIQFVVELPPGNYSATIYSKYPAIPDADLNGLLSGGFGLAPQAPGTLLPLGEPFNTVATGDYVEANQLAVVWSGPNGSAPQGDSVDACTTFLSYGNPGPFNCSGLPTVPQGPLTGPVTILPYPTLPQVTGLIDGQNVLLVEIVNRTGGVLFTSDLASGTGATTSPPFLVTGPGPSLLSDFAFTLGLLISLAGFMVVYWSYARPRSTSTVEMVLVRTVTRQGLFLVRYLSTAVLISAASISAVLLLDLGLATILLEPLPASFVAAFIGILVFAALAIAGLVYLASHLFRSTGAVLAVGIASVLVFSLFWSPLSDLAALVSGVNPNTPAFTEVLLRAQLIAPGQLPAIVIGFLTFQPSAGNGVSEYPSVGLTLPAVLAVTALWVVVPLALAYWRMLRRD